MQIRNATAQDIDFILATIHKTSCYEETIDKHINPDWIYQEDEREEYLKNISNKDHCIVILEIENERVWFLAWYIEEPVSWWRYKKISYLNFLFIYEEYRWKWYATALCEYFFNWARWEWSDRMNLRALSKNKSAIKLYRMLWFKPHIVQFWKDL